MKRTWTTIGVKDVPGRHVPSGALSHVIACIVVALASTNARADPRPAQSRKVREAQIGPLRTGSPLPQSFLECKPAFTSEVGEHFYYFPDPQHPDAGTRLEIIAECQDSGRRTVRCGPGAVRVANEVTVTAEPPYDLLKVDFCPLPVPLRSLRTSRGIRLGDGVTAVLRAYGPPSVKVATRKRAAELYRVLYTGSTPTNDGPRFDFGIHNRLVVEIRVYEGE